MHIWVYLYTYIYTCIHMYSYTVAEACHGPSALKADAETVRFASCLLGIHSCARKEAAVFVRGQSKTVMQTSFNPEGRSGVSVASQSCLTSIRNSWARGLPRWSSG